MVNSEKLKTKIKESVTNLNTLGRIPADEVQLNLDVAYNSILNEICAVVPMESPRQIVSYLKLKYGMPKKAVNGQKKDVIDASLMDGVGALPINEFGYMTDEVEFTASESPFIGNFKNILPGTVKIGNESKNIITDDGLGNLVNTAGDSIGTVDYAKAIFNTEIIEETTVRYKFDLYNVDTSRNLVYFEKATKEVFADIFQLDVDSAISLNDMKSLKLQDNIDKLLPEVLAKQIDNWALSKYFDYVDSGIVTTKEYKFSTWKDFDSCARSLILNIEMGRFARRTGVVPNVIICDPLGFAIVASSRNFKPLENLKGENVEYAGTPKVMGNFNGAKVVVTKSKTPEVFTKDGKSTEDGTIILTYRGPSDQASAVYSPFIPVTLRTVSGAEGGGTVVTNNVYSIGGFTFINNSLIQGVIITDIITEQGGK